MWPKAKFSRYDSLVLLSVTVFIFCAVSVYHFVAENGTNPCQMTYMFEFPQYVKINMTDYAGKIYDRYSLYAYSEGKFIERARAMKFTGIPILFVPGHGGSYKQVRSLASVTTHRTLDLQSIFHFDFFTIDFNGELSALYGGTLMDQHEFIISSVKKVLKLYPANNRPKSVIIIGHSMGGMIARSMFMSSSFDALTVKLIITLATPHQPVILIDKNLKDFYRAVDTFWEREKRMKMNRLENLTMISIGGGIKDILVRPELTFNELADLNVLTNAIPGVITSTDHLCIVWCNNFIKTMSRALYDAVDFDIRGITENRRHLRNIFHYHLVHCSNGKYYTPEIHREKIRFTKDSTWKELHKNFTSYLVPYGLEQDMHLLIKKPKNLDVYDSVMIEVINVDKRDWIAECNVERDDRLVFCDEGDNLSRYGVVGFNKTFRRKYFRSKLDSPIFNRHLQYLIVKLPATDERTGLTVDLYKEKSRTLNVNLDFSFFLGRKTVIKRTQPKALFYTIRLNNLKTVWQVYHLRLVPSECGNDRHIAFAVFKTPWNHDSSHVKVNWREKQILKIILLTIPSARRKGVPFVELILDPTCRYSVQIEGSYLDSLGVIAIRYALTLAANLATLLLLILVAQYSSLARRKRCPSFLRALKTSKGPYLAYPAVKLITYLWSSYRLDLYVLKFDTQVLSENAMDDFVVPVLIYLISLAILYVVGVALHFSILLYVHIYQRYSIGEWIERLNFLRNPNMADLIAMVLPVSLSTTIMSVACITCGGHGLIAGTMFYYANICSLHKNYVDRWKISDHSDDNANENDVEESDRGTEIEECHRKDIESVSDDLSLPKLDSVHVHSTLFLLWCLCTVTYLPSSIMWQRNMEFGSFILRDANFFVLFAYSCAIGLLWNCNIPYIFAPYYRIGSYLLFVVACAMLLACQVNIFRLPMLLTPVFVFVAVHQYYSRIMLTSQQPTATKSKQD